MTFAGLLNQPLTIQSRAGTTTDAYGNEVPTTTAARTVKGYAEQTAATEVTVDRQTYTTDWLVVLPPDVTIDGSDRVILGSLTLELIGQPHRVWNPRSRAYHHVSCRCQEVTG